MPHVLCVNEALAVMDDVAIKMTNIFYKEILNGEEICSAYEKAQRSTKFTLSNDIAAADSEVQRIKLLRIDFGPKSCMGVVKCVTLPKMQRGSLECNSQHNLVKYIPKSRSYKYRESEITKLLQMLLQKEEHGRERPRLFALEGYRGMGKSSLCLSMLQYAAERQMFLGGILFI